MTSDRRIKAYPLDPVRQRETWRLESLQAALAAAMRKRSQGEQACAALVEARRMAVAAATPTAEASLDPVTRRAHLIRLARLQTRIELARQAQARLRNAHEELQQTATAQQGKLTALDRHRAAFLREAARTIERFDAAEFDRTWLARRPRPSSGSDS